MKKGFTLAEVLVTLGIIGVVSAMTVPTLMQNHQRKTYVTQLHKVYNELNQAFQQFKNDNNALTLLEAGLSDQTAVNNFLKTYFKTVTVCDTLEEPCVYDAKYKNIPILMVTARSQEEDKLIGEETGADEYITKPFELDEVVKKVEEYLK